MANFIDQNNIEDFIDDNNNTLFIDQNGIFLGLATAGDTFPQTIVDQDVFYLPSVVGPPIPTVVSKYSAFYH